MTPKEMLAQHLENKKEDLLRHTDRVMEICERFVSELGDGLVNEELLFTAAALHDIAKFDGQEDHHKAALKIIEREGWSQHLSDPSQVEQIITAHRKSFHPGPDVELEAAILRLADKLDKFEKARLSCSHDPIKLQKASESTLDSCNSSLEKISTCLSSQSYQLLYCAYQNIAKTCMA